MNRSRRGGLTAAAGLALVALCSPSTAGVTMVSTNGNMGQWVHASGTLGNASEYTNSVSADGRYVAFVTDARNLGNGENAGKMIVAVLRDMQSGDITLVSPSIDNSPVNGNVESVSVSADGHYVVFSSDASNLVAGDTNYAEDVFLRDTWTGTTTRVSVPDAGGEANGWSWTTARCVSSDGRYIVFESEATNLVSGDTNNSTDVFVRDMQAHRTYLVSKSTAGVQCNGGADEPTMTANGRYVTFFSASDNLVPGLTGQVPRVYLRDMDPTKNTTKLVAVGALGCSSADGRYVAYNSLPGSVSPWAQVYVHDMTTGTDKAVSVAPDGVTLGNRDTAFAWLDDSGRTVCFTSKARNLVAGDTNNESDVFRRDLQTNVTTRLSVGPDGAEGARPSGFAYPSGDGRFVAFTSGCEDLVTMDLNESADVFITGALSGAAFQAKDTAAAAAIMGGRKAATAADLAAYNVVKTSASANRVDMLDAVRISRLVAGLDTAP